ncbi:MAG: hypothetical protein H0U72_04340 [Nitrosospira sp.]|nr:hypothetical protein [Nitrosospira sp.]
MKKESIWITIGIGILCFLTFEVMHYYAFNWKEWIIPGILVYIAYRLVKHLKGFKALPRKVKASRVGVKVPTASADIDAALLNQAHLIINAYGKTLEYLAPGPGCVADEQKLPFPKAKIKAAIKILLRCAPDADQRYVLEFGYLHLADFQKGVGSRNIGLDLSNTDTLKLSDSEMLSLCGTILKSTEEVKPWLEIAEAERIQLTEELRSWNLALP